MAKSKRRSEQGQFIEWLNATVPLFPIAADYHVIPRGDNVRDTQVYCPFHANVDTPSARIYSDSNNMHCFACGRDFGVYDFLTVLGGLNYIDVMQTYGAEYEGHVRESIASHRIENQRSILEDAAEDSVKRQTLHDFQRDLAGHILSGAGYMKWRGGSGSFLEAAAEMDKALTNDFTGYDYAEILRGNT